MKNKTKWILIVAALILVAAALYLLSEPPAPEAEVSENTGQQNSIPVRTTAVEWETQSEIRSFPGTVEEWDIAFISGTSGSRIIRMHVDEGDLVDQGDPLAEMEAANLRQAEVRLNTARREVNRLENLAGIGAVSGQQLDQAEAEYESALSAYEQLQDNTYLTSPIGGVVTDTWFVEGEIYSPGVDRPAIMTVMRTDLVKVVLHLSERYLPVVERGMPIEVTTQTWPDRIFHGQVHAISPTVDRQTRTFRVEVRMENPDRRLNPGMFVRASLNLGDREGLYLPARSLQQVEGDTGSFVYVVDGQSAERRPVTLGERHEEKFRVLSGLQEGDRVVTEGIGRLQEGSRVHVVR